MRFRDMVLVPLAIVAASGKALFNQHNQDNALDSTMPGMPAGRELKGVDYQAFGEALSLPQLNTDGVRSQRRSRRNKHKTPSQQHFSVDSAIRGTPTTRSRSNSVDSTDSQTLPSTPVISGFRAINGTNSTDTASSITGVASLSNTGAQTVEIDGITFKTNVPVDQVTLTGLLANGTVSINGTTITVIPANGSSIALHSGEALNVEMVAETPILQLTRASYTTSGNGTQVADRNPCPLDGGNNIATPLELIVDSQGPEAGCVGIENANSAGLSCVVNEDGTILIPGVSASNFLAGLPPRMGVSTLWLKADFSALVANQDALGQFIESVNTLTQTVNMNFGLIPTNETSIAEARAMAQVVNQLSDTLLIGLTAVLPTQVAVAEAFNGALTSRTNSVVFKTDGDAKTTKAILGLLNLTHPGVVYDGKNAPSDSFFEAVGPARYLEEGGTWAGLAVACQVNNGGVPCVEQPSPGVSPTTTPSKEPKPGHSGISDKTKAIIGGSVAGGALLLAAGAAFMFFRKKPAPSGRQVPNQDHNNGPDTSLLSLAASA